MLDTNQIDEETYNEEVNKLMQKAEKKKNYNGAKILAFFSNSKVLVTILFLIFIFCIYKNDHVDKDVIYVRSLDNIQEPIQIPTTGKAVKTKKGTTVEINYIASYNITGRVVDVQDYAGFNSMDILSPKDIGLTWGPLALDENNKKIKWTSWGDRGLISKIYDREWLNEMGGIDQIGEYMSNNHLIPSDERIKKLIKLIKVGDYIRIKGYLVNVYCTDEGNRYYTWNSSTTRTDTGSHACEVVYVTDISWLKVK